MSRNYFATINRRWFIAKKKKMEKTNVDAIYLYPRASRRSIINTYFLCFHRSKKCRTTKNVIRAESIILLYTARRKMCQRSSLLYNINVVNFASRVIFVVATGRKKDGFARQRYPRDASVKPVIIVYRDRVNETWPNNGRSSGTPRPRPLFVIIIVVSGKRI